MNQLMGGVMAVLGIYRAFPLVHGSQGCANYVKNTLAKHFKEPVEIATTGFYEISAIYGASDIIESSIKNILENRNPDLVITMTTGLSEITGEDIQRELKRITKNVHKDYASNNETYFVGVSTPSYKGTHIDGYNNTLKEIIKTITEKNKNKNKELGKDSLKSDKINIIPGFVNPGDVKEIKSILKKMDIDYRLLTDITTLDRPLRLPRERFPKCEATVRDIEESPNSKSTLSFGMEGIDGAKYLEDLGVPSYNLKFPIGIENTDNFIKTLSNISGQEIPESLWEDRGYAIDAIVDGNDALRNKRVAIFGDPDKVIGLTNFAFEMGMEVVAVLSNTETPHFISEIKEISMENNGKITLFEGSDLYQLHNYIKKRPADIIIGDYRGRYIANEERIPLLRVGFPIVDRYGYHRKPILGYNGALRITEEIINLLIESSENYESLSIL
ncbi:nitrogenase [Methanothermococcus sp. SCGC AD-155-K20]|nr:nitrogenase [Methanothermococcus sp. SCGC AD-155-K20]MBW9222905.1 nitrogenase [Methanothermococcus sp. SCGC AD-155-K20]